MIEAHLLTPADFPSLLRQTPAPPHLLYTAGNPQALALPSIAVVGSRAITPYGEQVCRYIVTGCVRAGFAIVSGLATGVDAVAHQTALELGGITIAVLGSGLAEPVIFPAGNRQLAKRIVEHNGVLVSEYPANTTARRHHFLDRNRILAGLSLATIIVEAAEHSGAINTAHHAIEANRLVFAVPGSILSSRSAGVHRLLQEGAQLFHSLDDLFAELPTTKTVQQADRYHTLSPEQKKILDCLQQQSVPIEQLAQLLQCSVEMLQANLTELEIQGIVRKNIWMQYQINP